MMERFKAYFEKLEGLSSEELDRSAEKLVRLEKQNVALLIAHIAEMSRRKAELERGYKNMFEYCVKRLNLSEGSVALRLQVANVSRRFPQILVALAENRISLSVAGLLATHLDEGNVEQLLSDCAAMTKRAAEEYLVRLRPKPVFTPSIRRQPAPALIHPAVQTTTPPSEESLRPAEESLQKSRRSTKPLLTPATPEQFNFRFAADRRFKEKFERLAEVLGVDNPMKQMAALLERAVDLALDQKDPKRKRERRVNKERKHSSAEAILVRTRFSKRSPRCPGTSRQRFKSACTIERGTGASTGVLTEGDARRGRDSRSNMNDRLPSSAATIGGFCGFCAGATIVSARNRSMGRGSFRPRSTKRGARKASTAFRIAPTQGRELDSPATPALT